MNWRILLAAILSMLAAGLVASPAAAQASRTWVSGVGDDLNPCSRTAPCKTFAGAISKTATGGEINCLDPGGFGAVTITKSLTIDCVGTVGGILASLTTGVTVKDGAGATPGTAVVNLRNLTINGGPTNLAGVNGIRFIRGARLNVENVTLTNFVAAGATNGFGIMINPSVGTARVHVVNSVIDNNGTASTGGGIGLSPTGSANVQLSLENVAMSGNFRGINAAMGGTTNGSSISVRGGDIVHSTSHAISVVTNANALNLMIEDLTIAHNGNGIVTSGAGSVTRIGGSTVTLNGTAFSPTAGAVIQSFKNNQVGFNTNDATPLPQADLN